MNFRKKYEELLTEDFLRTQYIELDKNIKTIAAFT